MRIVNYKVLTCAPPPPPLSPQGQVTYHLPAAGFSWSLVFRALEGNKERLGIVDYSISQTTLEQVCVYVCVCVCVCVYVWVTYLCVHISIVLILPLSPQVFLGFAAVEKEGAIL